MNYRLKRIQKGKPLKKTEHTDAIFENVKAVRAEAEADPETLEISIDTKTKVKLGKFSLTGKTRTDRAAYADIIDYHRKGFARLVASLFRILLVTHLVIGV